MHYYTRPIQISSLFIINEHFMSLRLRGHNEPDVLLTICHDDSMRIEATEIRGNVTTENYIVNDGDSLTIVARRGSDRCIIGAGVFAVDKALGCLGTLLIPCTLNNMLLDQSEGAMIDQVLERALIVANAQTEKVEVLR